MTSAADHRHSQRIRRHWSLILPLAIFGLLSLIDLLAILFANGGHFVYTLDDPYIHLTVSRNLLHGHYGINLQEYAAPSSSILWPLMLAPFMPLPQAEYVPLIISWIAAVGSIVAIQRVISLSYAPLEQPLRSRATAITVTLVMLGSNLIPLPFTGMEHSLQVLLTLLTTIGLLEEQRTGSPPGWLGAVLVLSPLIRYENLVLVGPALIYLLWRRHVRLALVCGALIAVIVGGFSLFLYSHGLGVLPSSVLAKSIGTQSSSFVTKLLTNVKDNILNVRGVLLAIGLPLLFMKRNSPERGVIVVQIAAILLHFVIGKFGWFSRYEIYIWASTALLLLYVYRTELVALIEQLSKPGLQLRPTIVLGVLCLCSMLYITKITRTPLAANNVYEQQYQMARFVAEYYRRPVAVNDLGLVAFNGGQYVLDFRGLGSHTALRMNETQYTADWMGEMAAQHNVKVALLYETWYPYITGAWVAMGDLHLSRENTVLDQHRVTFYARDDATARELRPLLEAFRTTLPEGVRFVLRPLPQAQP